MITIIRSEPARAEITVDTRHPLGVIDSGVYGHFLESAFFGNIEGGVLDEGSPLSITDPGLLEGLRADVLELCAELMPAPVRWPGGNFTSAYHWTDGIGPRDRRPTRLELAWGSRETNRFGTDEFLAWCEAIGGEPYLAHSARDVDEAVRWVEYTNATGTTLAGQRPRTAAATRGTSATGASATRSTARGRWATAAPSSTPATPASTRCS